MRFLGWIPFGLVVVLGLAWCAAALHYTGPRPALLADVLAAALVSSGLFVLFTVRPFGRTLTALVVLFAMWALWWTHVEPRNDRDWEADVARTPHVDVDGERLTFHDVRNFDYRSETDYTPRWDIRTVDLGQLVGMDLFMSYWGAPGIAHTIMSWEFADGQHLAVSIETRREKGEQYSAVKGFFKQFEIYYVVADERDVIRLRTNYRGEEVHLYQLRTPIERARRLLLDYVESVNELHARPQWYNAATANCTTSITRHIRKIGIAFPFDWRVIANGSLDEMLYEHGIIDTSRPFPDVRQASLVNTRAKAADQDPAFSARIRDGLTRPPLIVLPAGTE